MVLNKSSITVRLMNSEVDALKLLYDTYYDKFMFFARSYLKNKEDAEEVVQDVFVKIWTCRDKLDKSLTYEGLLHTIFKNTLYTRMRNRAKNNNLINLPEELSVVSESTEDQYLFNELLSQYHYCIQELPPQRRMVYQLKKEQEFTNKEVAQKLGISVKMVEKHMTLALKSIRSRIASSAENIPLISFLILLLL